MELIEVEVYSYEDPTVMLDVLNARMKPSSMEELNGPGGGDVTVSISDPKVVADPTLLDYRNVFKVRVNGKVIGAFILGKKKSILVDDSENRELYQISGQQAGLTWFDDAEVRPYGGLKKNSKEERTFSFASERGDWYNPAQWVTPTSVVNWGDVAGSPWRYAPAKWPDAPNAKWIWDRDSKATAPQGDVYIRYEWTSLVDAKHSFFVAGDDQYVIYVDGQEQSSSDSDSINWSEVNRIDVDLEAGDHVFAAKVTNTSAGPAAFIAAVYVYGDPTIPTSAQRLSWTGITTGEAAAALSAATTAETAAYNVWNPLPAGAAKDAAYNAYKFATAQKNISQSAVTQMAGGATWKICGYPDPVIGWSPGEIMMTLLEEAETRGVRFPTWLTPTFTQTLDSNGVTWPRDLEWTFNVGDSYSSVIEKLTELACDIWVDPDTFELNMAVERGVDRSAYKTVTGAVFTNLATNPAMEATDTASTVRTNLHVNPNSVGATQLGASGATSVSSVSISDLPGHTTARQWTVAVTPDRGYATVATTTPAGTYYPAVWVKLPVGGNFVVRTLTNAGNSLAAGPSTVNVAGTGAWQEIVLPPAALAASEGARLEVRYQSGTAGVVQATGWTLATVPGGAWEQVPSTVGDFSYAFSGTANSSTSTMSGVGVAAVLGQTSAAAIQSSVWSQSGKSVRAIPLGANNDSFVSLSNGDTGALRMGMQAGKFYTAIATIHLEGPLTGSLHTRARSLRVFTKPSGGAYTDVASNTAPNVAGTTELRIHFAVPAGSSEAFIRGYNGASAGNGDVWFDDFTLVEIPDLAHPYTGPAFSGSSADDAWNDYAWTSAANASTSTRTVQSVVPGTEPLIFEKGKNLRQATLDGVAEVKNILSMKTNDGWVIAEDENSEAKYGALEGSLSTDVSEAVSGAVADAVFKQKANPEEGASYEVVPIEGYVPWVDFNVGDWVMAPDDRGLSVRRRIVSISVEEDDAGNPFYAVEFDTIFQDNEDKLNKWMSKIGGGSLGGSFSNGSGGSTNPIFQPTNPPGGQPIVKIPKQVKNLAAASVGNWSADGVTPRSTITLTWNPVTANTDESETIPTFYEVWGHRSALSDDFYDRIGLVTGTTAEFGNFTPGDGWEFKVRAMNGADSLGEYSTEVAHTPVGPTAALAAPDAPTLSSSRGVLIVNWNGLIGGQAPAPQFRYVYVMVATTAGGTYTRMGGVLQRGGGNVYITGLTIGQEYFAKLVAVDGANISSAASSASSGHTLLGIDLGSLAADVAAAIADAEAAGIAAQSSGNALSDPSFERSDNDVWNPLTANVTKVTTTPRTGLKALRVHATAAAYEATRHAYAIPVEAGESWVLGGRVRADGASATVDGGVELSVAYGTADASTTSTVAVAQSPVGLSTTYLEFSGVWVVPAGQKFARPRVVVRDTSNTNNYLVDDLYFYKQTPSGLIVDGAITALQLSANAVTATAIQAGAVTAGKIAAGAVTAGTVAAGTITAVEIAAGSINSNHIVAGSIQTSHLSPAVGGELDISANSSVTIIVGQISSVQGDVDSLDSNLAVMQTYYTFGASGAIISKPGSPFAVAIRNDRIEMLENGNVVSYWTSGQMFVNSFVGEIVNIGNHQLSKSGTGTVIKAL